MVNSNADRTSTDFDTMILYTLNFHHSRWFWTSFDLDIACASGVGLACIWETLSSFY